MSLHDPARGWTFELPDGTRRVLRDPDGLPTSRLLAARGLLELRDQAGEPFSKLDAARVIEQVRQFGDGAVSDQAQADAS